MRRRQLTAPYSDRYAGSAAGGLMELNVADLLKDGYGSLREYDIDEVLRFDDEPHQLRGRVRLDRTPDGVLVRCELHGELRAECSRCLKALVLPIDVSFQEQYVPMIDVHTGAHIELREGEADAYRITPRHMIDLREPIEQYWTMAVPMAPVCNDACRGLCAVCGKELADGHVCESEAVDDRWARLRDLR
jgi:uncharacterized protein